MVYLKTIALSTAIAVLTASAPALAEVKTKPVQYNDLDLSSAKGQQRLATRIRMAVKAVCGNPRALTLAEKQDLARCQSEAMSSAMIKVERQVARYNESRRLAANESSAIVGN